MDETVTIKLNQQQMDILTDLIDRALKNPTSGGLQAIEQAGMIMMLLRQSVMQKQMAEQAAATPSAETGEGSA